MGQNTFHVSLYVDDIDAEDLPVAIDGGVEPAKVRHDYAKFELVDPPVILSVNKGGRPGTLSHLGIRYPGTADVASETVRTKHEGLEVLRQASATCCYAKADKFWVEDADGVRWEMYALLEDTEAQTAADPELRAFLGQTS